MQSGYLDLVDRVCVITGGGRGIGAAIAETFASQGAEIALLELDPALGEAAAARLREKGTTVRAYAVDVADERAVVDAAERVAEDFGKV
ncbi:MAG: SDR family NAD(P)-dependent oxidoreductase, partial [Gaiellaceae bacterium]